MSLVNTSIRQNEEIAANILAISRNLPAIKETEVVKTAYAVMANDCRKGLVNSTTWKNLLKTKYKDKKIINYSKTRGISYEKHDFDTIVFGDNERSEFAYLKQGFTSRVSVAFITKLVTSYVRQKIENENKSNDKKTNSETSVNTSDLEYLDLIEKALTRTVELIKSGDIKAINDYLGEK